MSPRPAILLHLEGGPRPLPAGDRLVLGRGEEADVRVPHTRISRLHCRLETVTGGGIKITDLASANGTFVNGQAISQVVLRVGDEILLGGAVRLEVIAATEADTADAPPAAAPSRMALPAEPSLAETPAAARPARSIASASASVSAPVSSSAETPRSAPAPFPAGEEPDTPSRRPRLATGAGRRNVLPAVLAGLGAVGALVIFLLVRSGQAEDEASDAARAAGDLARSGKILAALQAYEDLERRHPDSAAAARAKGAVQSLRQRADERRRGIEELDLILRDASIPTLDDMREQLLSVVRMHPDAALEHEIEQRLKSAEALFVHRADNYVRSVAAEVEACLGAGRLEGAYASLARAGGARELTGSAGERLEGLQRRVDGIIRREYGDLLRGLDALPPPEGVAKLESSLGSYLGTPFEGQLRARLSLLRVRAEKWRADVAARERAAADGPAAVPAEASPPPASLLDLLAQAEDLAAKRRYPEAVVAFDEALAAAPAEDRVRLSQRRRRLQGLGVALEALIARIKASPDAFRGIDIGPLGSGHVSRVDRDRVEITVGRKAVVRWDWRRLDAPRLQQLVARSGLQGEPAVEMAGLFLDMGDRGRALEFLARRLKSDPALRPRIEELAAEARGLSEVPAGGFHLHEGRFLTREERDESVLAARIADLGAQVLSADTAALSTPVEALRALGSRGEDRLRSSLQERLSTVLERAKKVPCLEPRRLRAYRERLFVELEKRRQTALALIMDDVQYPYPYAPDQAKVQAEVDRLAGEVRALWASPGGELLEKDGDLVGLREEIRHLTSLLGSSEGPDPEKALLDHVDAAIDMRHYDGNGSGIIDHWASVSAHNDSILAAGEMSQHERDCYTATNEYRVMMGLKAVMADPKLVQCARGHSIEMHELNYFSHTSPTEGRRSPGDRAQLAGWGGSVSENIARGSEDGFGVVVQWCHSSGHHRNILGRRWTHLGVGRAPEAAFWTQNFATGRAKPPKK